MAQSEKIVVFGSIVQDLISYTDVFPRPGESVRGHKFLIGGGGKGANQAVAAARLGADVHMIGRVGSDIFGDSNIDGLRKSGVNVDNVHKSERNSTATATITVNSTGENSIVVTLGANLELTSDVAEQYDQLVASAGLVMAQAEISQEGNRKIFQIARKHGVKTFFNPAPGDKSLDKTILKLVDIVCTNENEAEFLTGVTVSNQESIGKAASAMLEMGPEQVIITLGASGVYIASKDGSKQLVPVDKVKVVDTTGAGDCFCGTLAAGLVRGQPIAEAVKRAVVVAALSVTRPGTQNSYWTKEEILEHDPNLQL